MEQVGTFLDELLRVAPKVRGVRLVLSEAPSLVPPPSELAAAMMQLAARNLTMDVLAKAEQLGASCAQYGSLSRRSPYIQFSHETTYTRFFRLDSENRETCGYNLSLFSEHNATCSSEQERSWRLRTTHRLGCGWFSITWELRRSPARLAATLR